MTEIPVNGPPASSFDKRSERATGRFRRYLVRTCLIGVAVVLLSGGILVYLAASTSLEADAITTRRGHSWTWSPNTQEPTRGAGDLHKRVAVLQALSSQAMSKLWWSRTSRAGSAKPEEFANVLDFVHTVLVQRADPPPDAEELRRKAVGAIAASFGVGPKQGSALENERCSTWLKRLHNSNSFAVILQDSCWSSDIARQLGIDAGLRAMLGKTGWLLSRSQAERLRQMMDARTSGAAESPIPATSFAAKRLRPNSLYVHIPTFEDKDIGQRVAKELRKELTAGLDAVLIDLRNNPGGRPEQANAVADVFLDGQPLQIMRFADGRLVEIVSHAGASKVAVAVLVNRHTASAAEMLAMALRDNDRATLVGERTAGFLFGKEGVDLADGRMVFFRCEPTVLSPTRADYAVCGIPPDKMVAAKQSREDAVVQEALETVLSHQETSERGSHKNGP